MFTGGVFGVINRANVDVNDCEFYNLSVTSDYVSGGLVANCITASTPKVMNTHLYGNNISSIIGATYSGGFIGNTDDRSDGGETFILKNSSIEGYEIEGTNAAGGVIGFRGAKNDSAILRIENVMIDDCKIKSKSSAGAIAGEMKRPIQGYNILCSDVSFDTISGSGNINNNGYIVGLNTDSKNIKLVGFSRQESLGEGETSSMVQDIVGNGGVGSNGYVVFADYNGDCLDSLKRSMTFSVVNNTNNVKAADGTSTVTDNKPYVTSSTPTNIGGSYFLTSDGVSSSAYTNIAADITNSEKGRYSLAAENLVTQAGYIDDFESANTQIAAHLSTYQAEMGDDAVSGIDFPLLVVDDVINLNTTALINDYLRLLTNTSYKYNYNSGSNSNSNVFNTVLCKCTFSADNSTLTIDNTQSCLKMNGSYFFMNAGDTDTAAATPQFSLIDVQFKDPSDSSKIAYHLYVPVYVRKLLEYDFSIHIESGTDYVPTDDIIANTLLENLGVPVTAEIEYKYKRTTAEWQSAVDSGDNLLNNYSKKLRFTNSSLVKNGVRAGFEDNNSYYDCNTKMVLIDSQKGSKAYYCNSLSGSAFTETSTDNWTLDLQQFRDSSNTQFEASSLNDLMTITATQSNSGKFVCVEDAGGTATVKDNSNGTFKGKTFRLKEDSDSGQTLYDITVSDATDITEHYFLSIYTEADYEDDIPVYHYAISSPNTLGISPYPSRVDDNDTAHLLTGKIYNNSLTIEPKTNETDMYNLAHRSGDDYVIEATMTATVSISEEAEAIVGTYLSRIGSIEIYQSFLATLNMRNGSASDKGIKALKDTAVANYKVGGSTPANIVKTADSNFAEFKNNYNLRQKLATGAVVISADITLIFDDEDLVGGGTEETPNQFYPGPQNGVGTTLIGYSNIASNRDKTEYSKVSKEVEDTYHLYYYNSTENVDFEYNAYADNEIGLYGQLGINANDLDENPVPLTTLGIYDISRFQTSAASADYLKVEVELLTIDNAYNSAQTCNIGDYLTGLTFISSESAISSDTSNAKKWTYIYPKNAFAIEAQTYQIPINYSIYSGNTAEFEGSSKNYSNYEVKITVSMWANNEEEPGELIFVPNSEKSDYIKYTNARIYTERVNPNKDEP